MNIFKRFAEWLAHHPHLKDTEDNWDFNEVASSRVDVGPHPDIKFKFDSEIFQRAAANMADAIDKPAQFIIDPAPMRRDLVNPLYDHFIKEFKGELSSVHYTATGYVVTLTDGSTFDLTQGEAETIVDATTPEPSGDEEDLPTNKQLRGAVWQRLTDYYNRERSDGLGWPQVEVADQEDGGFLVDVRFSAVDYDRQTYPVSRELAEMYYRELVAEDTTLEKEDPKDEPALPPLTIEARLTRYYEQKYPGSWVYVERSASSTVTFYVKVNGERKFTHSLEEAVSLLDWWAEQQSKDPGDDVSEEGPTEKEPGDDETTDESLTIEPFVSSTELRRWLTRYYVSHFPGESVYVSSTYTGFNVSVGGSRFNLTLDEARKLFFKEPTPSRGFRKADPFEKHLHGVLPRQSIHDLGKAINSLNADDVYRGPGTQSWADNGYQDRALLRQLRFFVRRQVQAELTKERHRRTPIDFEEC